MISPTVTLFGGTPNRSSYSYDLAMGSARENTVKFYPLYGLGKVSKKNVVSKLTGNQDMRPK